jgi:hypothetical protein
VARALVRASRWLALPLATACGAPEPAPARPWAPPRVFSPQPAPLDPRAPLTVPVTGGAPAPWLEPLLRKAMSPLASPKQVAAGRRAAVVELGDYEHDYEYQRDGSTKVHDRPRVPRAFVLVSEEQGVLGPLVPPVEPVWIGVDGDDHVYITGDEGALFVAEGPKEAALGRFERRGARPLATRWDVGDGLVAAAQGDELAVSRDGGETFRTSLPRKGQRITQLFVRFDGVIVVRVEDQAQRATVLSSTDGGKSFRAPRYQPEKLMREGAWIWNGRSDCPAVLAADGRAFTVDRAGHDELRQRRRWSAQVQASKTMVGFLPDLPADRLDAPPLPDRKKRGALEDPLACSEAKSGVVGGLLGSMGPDSGCVGVRCLRNGYVESEATGAHQALFFADAPCDRAEGSNKRWCASDARLLRPPHWALIDRRTGALEAVAELPGPCQPGHLHAHRGLNLLVCGTGAATSSLFTLSSSKSWTHELDLPLPASALRTVSGAADGTLLVHLDCAPVDIGCRALVRAPLALGDPRAYRELAVPGAQAYRALEGGAALAFVASPDGRQLALGLCAADGSQRALTPFSAPLDGVLGASITAGRNVQLSLRAGAGPLQRRDVVVTNDGGWIEAPRRRGQANDWL